MGIADNASGTEDLAARRLMYRFLAQCYSYPEPDFVQGLHRPELWDCLAAAARTLGGQIGRLRACITSEASSPLDLQIEFTYLFVNAMPHLPAPPYESAYGEEGLLMGEAVSQVLRAYQEAGLAMNEIPGLLPDQLTTELEFMACLIGQEASARREEPARVETWQAQQHRFLTEHLLRWGPRFVDRVAEHARRPFYAHVADLTAALLHSEEQRLHLSASVARRKR